MTRTTFIDFDARPNPKTNLWCCKCQKDLKPCGGFRYVYVVDGMEAVHSLDLQTYQRQSSDLGFLTIGTDCARQVGLDFTFKKLPYGEVRS